MRTTESRNTETLVIDEARQAAGPALSFLMSYVPRALTWKRAERLPTLRNLEEILLLRRGRIVWAHVLKAHREMYQPTTGNYWGVTLFSPDPYFDHNPHELVAIATRLGDLRLHPEKYPDQLALSRKLNDDYCELPAERISPKLTDGKSAYIAQTLFYRKQLPFGRLLRTLIPILIMPRRPDKTLPLPLRYWPDRLQHAWTEASRNQPPESIFDIAVLPLPEMVGRQLPQRHITLRANHKGFRDISMGEVLKTLPQGVPVYIESGDAGIDHEFALNSGQDSQIILVEVPSDATSSRNRIFETVFYTTNGERIGKIWEVSAEPFAPHRGVLFAPLSVQHVETFGFKNGYPPARGITPEDATSPPMEARAKDHGQ